MGIFNRMSNMIKGKVNATLDEMENPIELLDQKIKDMEEQLGKAKLNSAQVLGNVHAIENKMNAAKNESEDYDSKVKLALSKQNEDLAKRALAKKVEADKQYESLLSSYNTAKAQADSLKRNLRALEEEINKTRAYRDEASSRYATAKASKKVNEVLENIQTKTNSIDIDSIERKIAKEEAIASGLGDLKDIDNLDSELENLDTVDLDAELEKYKSQL